MRSRRLVDFRVRASASAFVRYSSSASAFVRPLISTLIGVCGKARRTSFSVGTRKSAAVKPFGGLRLPVATPRRR